MYHQQTTIFSFLSETNPLPPLQPSLFTLPFLISPSRGPSEQQQQSPQQPPSMTKKNSHSQQQQQKKKQEANPQKQPSQAASTRANFARDCFYYSYYQYYCYYYYYYCYTMSKVSAVDIEGGCEPQSRYTCFGQTWNDVDPEGG